MTLAPRRLLAAALATGAAGATAALLVGAPASPSAAPAPAPVEIAAPGLCIDLSELALPSICVDSLLAPASLG